MATNEKGSMGEPSLGIQTAYMFLLGKHLRTDLQNRTKKAARQLTRNPAHSTRQNLQDNRKAAKQHPFTPPAKPAKQQESSTAEDSYNFGEESSVEFIGPWNSCGRISRIAATAFVLRLRRTMVQGGGVTGGGTRRSK